MVTEKPVILKMENKINVWIRYLFPIFLAIFLGTLIFMMAQFREPPGFEWYGMIWFIGSIFLIWECAWWISKNLDKEFPWRKGTFKRLMIQIMATNLVGILLFLCSFLLINWYENEILNHDNSLTLLHILVVISEAFIIVQIVNSVQIGYQLLQTWQEVQLEAETYKKESAIMQLETVRQLIDPHYLNNNIGDLENIIKKSPEKISAYLKELSENYKSNQTELDYSLATVQKVLKITDHKSRPQNIDQSNKSFRFKTRFLVRSGSRIFLIPVEKIVAFYKDDVVLLFTKEGKKYTVDYSLEDLITQLDPHHFFRINRQCIVQAAYLDEMRIEGNHLYITMTVPVSKSLTVSQRNISAFKQWVNGE